MTCGEPDNVKFYSWRGFQGEDFITLVCRRTNGHNHVLWRWTTNTTITRRSKRQNTVTLNNFPEFEPRTFVGRCADLSNNSHSRRSQLHVCQRRKYDLLRQIEELPLSFLTSSVQKSGGKFRRKQIAELLKTLNRNDAQSQATALVEVMWSLLGTFLKLGWLQISNPALCRSLPDLAMHYPRHSITLKRTPLFPSPNRLRK